MTRSLSALSERFRRLLLRKTVPAVSLAVTGSLALVLAGANAPALAASTPGAQTVQSVLPPHIPSPAGRPQRTYGGQAHWVAVLQADLHALGLPQTGPTAGIFVPATESGVKSFEANVGLPSTGVAALATRQDIPHGLGHMPPANPGSDPAGIGTATTAPMGTPQTIDGRPVLRTFHMIATAYGPSLQDNYPYGATNYFGQPLTPGTVAVDPSVIPLKSELWVQGYQDSYLPSGGFLGQALDTGGAIQGDRIDIFMNDNAQIVSNFGIQPVTVYVLGHTVM